MSQELLISSLKKKLAQKILSNTESISAHRLELYIKSPIQLYSGSYAIVLPWNILRV